MKFLNGFSTTAHNENYMRQSSPLFVASAAVRDLCLLEQRTMDVLENEMLSPKAKAINIRAAFVELRTGLKQTAEREVADAAAAMSSATRMAASEPGNIRSAEGWGERFARLLRTFRGAVSFKAPPIWWHDLSQAARVAVATGAIHPTGKITVSLMPGDAQPWSARLTPTLQTPTAKPAPTKSAPTKRAAAKKTSAKRKPGARRAKVARG